MNFHPYFFNPNGLHLMRYASDPQFRHIIMYGGSSSGKSYAVAQVILILTLTEKSNTLVMRKVGASILDTIYQDFKSAARQLHITEYFTFKDGVKRIDCFNGARIVFKGCDDPEKIKGVSQFKRIVSDEWNEFEEDDDKQLDLRLRGMPGQQRIKTFNPIKDSHWIKKKIFDREDWIWIPPDVLTIRDILIPRKLCAVKSIRYNKPRTIFNPFTQKMEEHASDTVVIQSTYLNNFWVVGSPNGEYGYYDEQVIAEFERCKQYDPDYYNVYALGEWGVIRTGSEFFGSFNRVSHVSQVQYDPALPVHISVDSNVMPYITCTYWQVDTSDGFNIRQIGETLAESPDNTVKRSAKLVASRLAEWGALKVYMHGDASTRAANNIDDRKRSFHDLFIDTLQQSGIDVVDKVSSTNPSVQMTGEFINAIYDGAFDDLKITIGQECQVSIEDYQAVQKDVNGAILKKRVTNRTTGQSYEEHGHCSDTKRYVVADVLSERFLLFSNRRKRNLFAKNGIIRYFNPATEVKYSASLLYVMPNVEGKIVCVESRKCGRQWHVVYASIEQTESMERLREIIVERGCPEVVVECPESYFTFVRELREEIESVRVKRLASDLVKRIAATSDSVKSTLLFDPSKADSDAAYGGFVINLLDYGADPESVQAAAALSGLVTYIAKWVHE